MRLALACLVLAWHLPAAAVDDPRYCRAEPARTSSGRILRSKIVLRQFQSLHPCPVTGSPSGKCPGWQIDHVIPLACGGCDSIANLQWLPTPIKAASGITPKDRWERPVYCR